MLLTVFSYNYSFSLDLVVLEAWKSSGRPVGRFSTNFRQKRSGGVRAMTQNPDKKYFGCHSPIYFLFSFTQ